MMKSIAIFILGLLIILASCNHYPDGPSISMRSKTARLSNDWKIESYYVDGEDKTSDANSLLNGYLLSIDKDGTYSLTYKIFSLVSVYETGTWVFDSEKDKVIFTKTSPLPSTTSEWTILRLKEKELWGQYTDNSKVVKVQLVSY